MPMAAHRSRSTTWLAAVASCRSMAEMVPWAIQLMPKRRPGPTTSLRRSWQPVGKIRTSTRCKRRLYYDRALEIPTPRWTAYDSVVFGFDLPEGTPTDLQERAYTSPIWYNPDRRMVRFNLNLRDYIPMTVQERAYTSLIWYTQINN